MLKLLIITAVLLGLCFLAMAVRILIKGTFAETEVGHNKDMRKLGLCCAKEEEIRLWKNNGSSNTDTTCGSCSTCGASDCLSKILD